MPGSKRPKSRNNINSDRSNILPLTRSENSHASSKLPLCFSEDQARRLDIAEKIITARALRNEVFPSYFHAERAWDISLVIYFRSTKGDKITVTSLVEEIGAPHATACRWIDSLAARGLLKIKPDHLDARRKFVEPTDQLLQRMEMFLNAVQKLGLIGH